MLEINHIYAGYGRTTVLQNVSLVIPDHGIITVIGHNGAGKTTLLKTIMGLLPAKQGSIRFRGTDITHWRPNRRVAHQIAYVPQGQQSFTQLTTMENLRVIADTQYHSKQLIDETLAMFPALQSVLDRKAGLLSGGQRQQLAFARAIMTQPKLLILDEPTEGIQPSVVNEIEATIVNLAANKGIGVLLVEQKIAFALQAAQQYYVLANGRIIAHDQVTEQAEQTVRTALSI